MNTRDPLHPSLDGTDYDPAQLSFGDVAAVPQLRVERQGEASQGADGLSVVTFREPPVCGESSYDELDGAGPGWSVRLVQETESAPTAPRASAVPPARATGNSAAPVTRPAASWTVAAVRPPTSRPAAAAPDVARPASTRPGAMRPAFAPRDEGSASPRASSMPEAMIAPSRPTPVALPSASLDPLKRATELSPRDVDAVIAYAQALDKHGNAAGALSALDECLANGGDELRLICARAFLLGSRLKYDLAEAELKRAAKLRADDPEVQLQAGILSCRRARWRDAVEPLQKAASQRSDDALAHFYLGEALNHVDQLPAALAAYERATILDPSAWRAFKGVGIVLDRLGRPTDAAVAYRRMREVQGR
ncbi:MAG: tetratricopeptide repeat protein [Gemmatimonadota bacterium]